MPSYEPVAQEANVRQPGWQSALMNVLGNMETFVPRGTLGGRDSSGGQRLAGMMLPLLGRGIAGAMEGGLRSRQAEINSRNAASTEKAKAAWELKSGLYKSRVAGKISDDAAAKDRTGRMAELLISEAGANKRNAATIAQREREVENEHARLMKSSSGRLDPAFLGIVNSELGAIRTAYQATVGAVRDRKSAIKAEKAAYSTTKIRKAQLDTEEKQLDARLVELANEFKSDSDPVLEPLKQALGIQAPAAPPVAPVITPPPSAPKAEGPSATSKEYALALMSRFGSKAGRAFEQSVNSGAIGSGVDVPAIYKLLGYSPRAKYVPRVSVDTSTSGRGGY